VARVTTFGHNKSVVMPAHVGTNVVVLWCGQVTNNDRDHCGHKILDQIIKMTERFKRCRRRPSSSSVPIEFPREYKYYST
jgi:hypothetical protein